MDMGLIHLVHRFDRRLYPVPLLYHLIRKLTIGVNGEAGVTNGRTFRSADPERFSVSLSSMLRTRRLPTDMHSIGITNRQPEKRKGVF